MIDYTIYDYQSVYYLIITNTSNLPVETDILLTYDLGQIDASDFQSGEIVVLLKILDPTIFINA